MVLHLKEKVSLPEHLLELPGCTFRLVVLAGHQVLVDFASQTAGEAISPSVVPRKKIFRHARLAIEAVQRGLARQSNEIAIARFVFGEHEKVLIPTAHLAMVGSLGEVEFAAENRLEILLLHGVEEVDRAVDIAMVGHGGGGLADACFR